MSAQKVISEYDQQAANFLNKFKIDLTVKHAGHACPPWAGKEKCDHVHGDRYEITLERWQKPSEPLRFDFWGSLNDKQKRKLPSAYSVLACIGSDAHTPDTFEDFCSEYGYEEDSRSAFKSWQTALEFTRKLRAFFTPEEIEALVEIR
jgi:hypothetical protein